MDDRRPDEEVHALRLQVYTRISNSITNTYNAILYMENRNPVTRESHIGVDDPIRFGCEILSPNRFLLCERLLPSMDNRLDSRLPPCTRPKSSENSDNGREAAVSGRPVLNAPSGDGIDDGGCGLLSSSPPPPPPPPVKKADSRRRTRMRSAVPRESSCSETSSLISSRACETRRSSFVDRSRSRSSTMDGSRCSSPYSCNGVLLEVSFMGDE